MSVVQAVSLIFSLDLMDECGTVLCCSVTQAVFLIFSPDLMDECGPVLRCSVTQAVFLIFSPDLMDERGPVLCCSLHHFQLGFIVAMSQDCRVTSIFLNGFLECDNIAEVVHNTPRQVPERLGSTMTMGTGECEVGGRQLLQFFEWLNGYPSPSSYLL